MSNPRPEKKALFGIPMAVWGQRIDEVKRRLGYATYVSEKYEYIFVENPKAACTTWKRIIQVIESLRDTAPSYGTQETRLSMFIHDRKSFGMKNLLQCPERDAYRLITDPGVYRFAFVRNPYSRLFSAWKNKVWLSEPGYFDLKMEIATQFHNDIAKETYVPFRLFAQFVCRYQNLAQCNYHWRLQTKLLFPHVFNYSFIGKFENFADDAVHVLSAIGISEVTQREICDRFIQVKDNRSSGSDAEWKQSYDADLAEEVYRAFESDFTAFNYEKASWQSSQEERLAFHASQSSGRESWYQREIFERNRLIECLYVELFRSRKQAALGSASTFPPVMSEERLHKFFECTEGMINFRQFKMLYELARAAKLGVVEVGSYRGRSTTALSLGARAGGKIVPVFAIEPHEEFNGIFGGKFGSDDRAAFYKAMMNCEGFKNVRLVNLSSEIVTSNWRKPIDLLWIDGDHSYAAVSRDFECWRPYLTEDATVVFDDSVGDTGPGRLVQEIVRNTKFQMIGSVDSLTILKSRTTS